MGAKRCCFFQSAAWASLRRAYNFTPAEQRHAREASVSYATGGAYGFNRRALQLVTQPRCMSAAVAAVIARGEAIGVPVPGAGEDETVGLCMHLQRVRLIRCGCFYQYGPCNCYNFSSCFRADGASRPNVCHLPLTIHKLKKAEWFHRWWRMLSAREPSMLAAFRGGGAVPSSGIR